MYEFALSSLLKASWETIYMVFISSFLSIFIGLILGTLLFISKKNQSVTNNCLNHTLSFIVNITRSLPFIILMISVIPLTRLLVGTTIGTNAAIVPLTIAAIPFFARICESALEEVPAGLIETANAMGTTTWQLISKILIPESLPSLIRGGTLTIIGLIGYSAMAGVVGGGGLGELAINYGYQRFNVIVMLETVIILIILVQCIQAFGSYLANQRQIKTMLLISVALWFACIGYAIIPAQQNQDVIRVGVMSGASEQIMQIASNVAKNDYGINLKVIHFNDYVQPNTALNNNSIDANIFQHAPYLEGQIKAHHYQLLAIAKTFVYPMGYYSKKIKSLKEMNDGALLALPNDPSNEGRALLLLENIGLIKLKSGVGTFATVNDIIENRHHLQFKLLDAAQAPRALDDVDLVAITNDFVGPAGLDISQAVIKESKDSPYANLIVVRSEDKDNPLLQKLVDIMHSQAVIQETQKVFPNGAAIPAW